MASRRSGDPTKSLRWETARVYGPAALLLYCALLTAFASGALSYAPLHHDMTEAWAWGREFQLGYVKHPPLSAWIAGLWFMFVPKLDWTFYLLASINAAVGLVGVWRLTSVFVPASGCWFAVLLLALTPSFTIWATKFNVNAPLLSTWPWTTYLFLRSLETRRISFSMLTGAVGAMAMLTKYSSVVLFATLLIVALTHPARRQYLASRAPYVTVLTGLALMVPHIWWLFSTGFPTIEYAIAKTQAATADAQEHTFFSAAGSIAGLTVGAAALAFTFGRRGLDLLRNVVAACTDRSVAWIIALACGPFLLTVAGYLVGNLRVSGGFLIPVFFAMPVAVLVLGRAQPTPSMVRRLAAFAAAVWMTALIASPLLADHHFMTDEPLKIEPRREVAIGATKFWRAAVGRPLRYVSGTAPLATAATFYSPDSPSYVALDKPKASLWASAEDVRRHGMLVICRAADAGCVQRATRSAGPHGLRHADTFGSSYLGRASKPQRFIFFLLPPSDVELLWD